MLIPNTGPKRQSVHGQEAVADESRLASFKWCFQCRICNSTSKTVDPSVSHPLSVPHRYNVNMSVGCLCLRFLPVSVDVVLQYPNTQVHQYSLTPLPGDGTSAEDSTKSLLLVRITF